MPIDRETGVYRQAMCNTQYKVYMKHLFHSNIIKHCYSSRPVILIRWIYSNVLGGSA